MTGRTKIGVLILIILVAALGYGYLADRNPNDMISQEKDKGKKDEEKFYKAPDFTLKNIEGENISLSDYKGKVVFINFWATWCGPCRQEIPAFVELQEEFGKDKLVILGISLDQGDLSVVEDFADEFEINYEVLYGTQQVSAAYGGIQSIPTTFVVDGNGNIRDGGVGFPGKDYFKKVVEALL